MADTPVSAVPLGTPVSGDSVLGEQGGQVKRFPVNLLLLAPHVGPTPPVGPIPGKQWTNTNNGKTYTWYDDGNSSQWVESAGFYYVDDPVVSQSRAAAEAAAELATQKAAAAANSVIACAYIYPGSYNVEPLTRPDGTPRQTGDQYFNGVSLQTYRWSGPGGSWVGSDINTAQLAASNGSSFIGFIQAGVGAIVRTLLAWIRERVPSVKDYGVVGGGVTDDAAALQVAIDAVSAAGGGEARIPPGTYRLNSQVTVKTGVTLRLDHGATIIHGANTKLFRMKPRSRLIGGKVDVSATGLAAWSSVAFEFDGTDALPNFRGVEPTVVQTELKSRRGAGTGTAFHLHALGAGAANVYGVQVDATIDGFEFGAHLQSSDSGGGIRWVNGNFLRLRAMATVSLVKQTTTDPGKQIDGNIFDIEYQTTAHTGPVLIVEGRYNQFRGMIWDLGVGTSVQLGASTTYNFVLMAGLLASTISDAGTNNTILSVSSGNPSFKVNQATFNQLTASSLEANTGGDLPIKGMTVTLDNNKSLRMKDSGGVARSVLLNTTGNNLQLGIAGIPSVIAAGDVRYRAFINNQARMDIDNDNTAGNTAMVLWDCGAGTAKRVSVGAADSGGAGFKVLRIAN
jgi:hypothetical protein